MPNAAVPSNAPEAEQKLRRATANAPEISRTSMQKKQRSRVTGEKPKRNQHAILPPVIGSFLILLSLAAGIFVTQYTDRPEATKHLISEVLPEDR